MDDTRTQQALDHLADLFLTGQGPVAKTQDPPADPQRDELVGPAPIRLRPKLTEKPRPAGQVTHEPPIKVNAPLRLQSQPDDSPIASIGEVEKSDDAPPQTSTQDAPTPPDSDPSDHGLVVEAVILGNLPGLSGPWLTQYAQLLAQQEGPVVILHIDEDLIDLELVEPTNRETPDRGVSFRMSPGGGKIDPRSILEALLDSPDPPDSAPGIVLVHLDPQHDELGLTRALAIDDWTLMCGADDLAIVGGYKMLKTMVEKDPAVAGKRIGLMIMGSDPKDSQDAARKFQSAAESFLNTPVQLLGWQKQMVPVNLRHLGRFEDVDAAWPRLAQWFSRYAATDPTPVAEPVISEPIRPAVQEPAVTPVVAPAPKSIREPEPAVPIPAMSSATGSPDPPGFPTDPSRPKLTELFTDPPPVAVKPRRVEPTIPPETIAPAQTKTPKPVRPPAPEPAATAQTVFDETDLVELLMAGSGTVPGGIALEARCPHQPMIQLMLDQRGRLHLLCRHDSQAGGIDSLQPTMVDLLQARHWVREHLELLALTQRQCRFDVSCEPVLHLFTDRADWATALIARLGEALKLHLLQEVHIGEESAWFCTPLN